MSTTDEAALEALAEASHRAQDKGLVVGSSGNVSCRLARASFAVSPSGWELSDLQPRDFVVLPLEGDAALPVAHTHPMSPSPPDPGVREDPAKVGPPLSRSLPGRVPSSEWRLHRSLYGLGEEVGAIIHTHSPYATALACMERTVPPMHYYLALLGGEVPLVPYAPYGSAELAEQTACALKESTAEAVLLAHHGALALGRTPAEALMRAEILEHLCQIYLLCLGTGREPPLLTPEELEEAGRRMRSYSFHPHPGSERGPESSS